MASAPFSWGGQATKIGPLPSPCRLLATVSMWIRDPKGSKRVAKGACEGHLEFVYLLGAFLEGKMSQNGAFFASEVGKNQPKTGKGEKPIRAYPPMKNLVFEGGRLSKTLQKGVQKACRCSLRYFTIYCPLWESILVPKCSKNEPKCPPGPPRRPLKVALGHHRGPPSKSPPGSHF